jgi:hypothetical protein
MTRYEWAMAEALPGPPSVDGLRFRSVAFAPPYEQHAWAATDPAARISLEPIDGGVRGTVTGELRDGCTVTSDDRDGGVGHAGGIRVPVNGLRAARFEVNLIASENIVGFNVYAHTRTNRSIRWRWQLSPQAQQFGYTGTFTLVPGHPARALALSVDTARRSDVHELHIFAVVKPGTRAGFELRNLEIAEP